MRKNFLIFLLFVSISSFALSQKLTGTVIGDFNAFNYDIYSCSLTVNTPLNAFDGNLGNTYAACDRDNGWVGLDLGTPHVIEEVAYCPESNKAGRLELGVFEGANNPDFGDAIPIYMITEIPDGEKLTKKSINNSRAFRYVRYKGPADTRCNIAEVEFYGTKSAGDDSKLFQLTNLPTIILHTKNEVDVTSKETYLKGIISVISEKGTNIFFDSMEIKGRGNASWTFPKKPYRLKLYNKASLLGMPAIEKNWTLINNYGDKTLMRNLLAFDLSKKLEMPYTPAGKPVDVFLNGQYKGTYQLCDYLEVASNRVPAEKMSKTTTELPNLSGGYFLEMDGYAYTEISWFESTKNKIPVTIKYPKDDEINSTQRNYIVQHFSNLENALFSSVYTNPNYGYRNYMDIDTFLRLFLVGEISGNTDTFWSTFMYKFKNNNKFYFGPVWDFDLAYENDYRTYPINSLNDWLYNTNGSSARGVKDFVNRIFSDTASIIDLKSIYSDLRNSSVVTEQTLLDVVDSYVSELNQSQLLNFKRWNIMNEKIHGNPKVFGSYEAEVENIRNFIKNRIVWIDNKLGYMPNALIHINNPDMRYWSRNETIFISGISSNANIQVFDLMGRIREYKSTSTDFTIPIEKGIYIVRIKETYDMCSNFKIIVK
ncbi:CotH kinase family protein [Macellibacteroides fermentans]|uniref:CotH kinase family protein n=1 Tax=Macellibacteroides fermentans TaxID=879969 RepID=UPI00352D6586